MPLPNSLPWMESVDAKMIRAHELIETIARETNEWFSTIKITTSIGQSPEQPHPWLTVWASDYIPPIRLNILVGECVHNMRSGLDNLVCGLALTKDRLCGCNDLGFPFTEHEAGWSGSSPSKLAGIPKEARKIIKTFQPWSDSVQPSPLVIVNKLSNIDKHRACNFTLAYSRGTTFLIHCAQGPALEYTPPEPIYLGEAHTAVLPIDKSVLGTSTRIQSSGTLVMTFREESDWDDLPVVYVLQNCFDHIEKNVIARLRKFFEPTPTT